MTDYLQHNYDFWQRGYDAENVESWVFRPYGRIFKSQFNITGSKREKMLDFGCGQGASLQFFDRKGFDVYGVDISKIDIDRCRAKMQHIADHFIVVDPKPKREIFFGGNFDLIISIQTLYYLSDTDLNNCLESLYNQMKNNALIYVSMMGEQCDQFFKHSVEIEDGMREINFTTDRLSVSNCFINFTESEEDLLSKFSMFKKIHTGYYSCKYRDDEECDFHYTFIGQK